MACPFCMTMLSTGMTEKDKNEEVKTLDIAELIAMAEDL
jgi:Fe-S oxidoreductase